MSEGVRFTSESVSRRRCIGVVLSLALLLVFSAVVASVSPYAMGDESSTAQSKSPGDRALRIGWVDLMGEFATLNPLETTSQCEKTIIWPCYSTLLTYDSDGDEIGDLARSWTISGDGLNITFNLYESAQFYSKANPPPPYGSGAVQPVTARDVIFTYGLIQNETDCNLHYYLPSMAGSPIIQNMSWGPTLYDLRITLSSSFSPILSAFHAIPILPRYIWIDYYDPPNHKVFWNWDNFGPLVSPCIGSGPFYYNLAGLPMTGSVELVRSPTWYATEEHGWQLKCNRIVYVSEPSPATMLTHFQNDQLDIMEWCTLDQYLQSIPAVPGAIGQRYTSGYVYEYNANQMTDTMRATLGDRFSVGSNNQLLLDPVVKMALAMSYDKQTFADQVCGGLGRPADSLVPYNHRYYYDYGGAGAPPGEVELTQDTAGARALLYNAGWQYKTAADGAGHIVYGSADYYSYYPLCKIGGTSQLSFRFCTLSNAPEWDIGGRLLAGWAEDVGIDLWNNYSLKSTGQMNGAWFAADYDMWLWMWDFPHDAEVSTDILRVMTTMDLTRWSDAYYSNATYDLLYNQSIVALDPSQRRVITDEMQRMIYEDHGCQPVAYKDDLFAMKASAPDYWGNWGNWTERWTLEPSQGYPWLFMMIEPADNSPPYITMTYSHIEGLVNTTIEFAASGTDDSSGLEYRWIFGDGSKSSWSSNPTTTHSYSTDGYFTATAVARESSGSDGYMSYADVLVVIRDPENSAPHGLDFTCALSDPNTGDLVTLIGSATDDEGDPLTFSWDFGDGHSAFGQSVSHQFVNGSSNVTMYVDDGHLGMEPRPVALTRFIAITDNSLPTIHVPDYPAVTIRQYTTFMSTCTDLNQRDQIRLTWYWGDGTVSVTNLQSNGDSFDATEGHRYYIRGIHFLTVWIDDMTGLQGHNVSDEAIVNVLGGPPKPPVISSFTVDDSSPEIGEPVTFTLLATDQDPLDILILSIDFGDGESASTYLAQGIPWVAQHVYLTSGLFEVLATVTDGVSPPVQELVIVTVTTPSFEVHLAAGWNQVTLPLVGWGYTSANLGLSFGSLVVRWNETWQNYSEQFIVGISPPSWAFPIVPGYGYWIFTPTAKTLTLYGAIPIETQYLYCDFSGLAGGWTMIGFVGLNQDRHASDLPLMYSVPGAVKVVSHWNPWTGMYQSYISEFPMTDFALVPGQAYWVWCTASGYFAYEP